MEPKKIETKRDEIRFKTLDINRMNNKYLVNKLFREWTEDFVDSTTGQIVSIQRHEIVFNEGVLLTPANLQRIAFHIQAGDITEPIEVSNQRRSQQYQPLVSVWDAKVSIGGKSRRYILRAKGIQNALDAVIDFTEILDNGDFRVVSLKDYSRVVILEDCFKEKKVHDEDAEDMHKFYRISAIEEVNNEIMEGKLEFLVKAESAERALMVINNSLNEKEKNRAEKAGCEPDKIRASIDECKIENVTAVIPDEFAKAHQEE